MKSYAVWPECEMLLLPGTGCSRDRVIELEARHDKAELADSQMLEVNPGVVPNGNGNVVRTEATAVDGRGG